MNLKQLKEKLDIDITVTDKVEFLLEEVYNAIFGTKNRSRLILKLEDILNDLRHADTKTRKTGGRAGKKRSSR